MYQDIVEGMWECTVWQECAETYGHAPRKLIRRIGT